MWKIFTWYCLFALGGTNVYSCAFSESFWNRWNCTICQWLPFLVVYMSWYPAGLHLVWILVVPKCWGVFITGRNGGLCAEDNVRLMAEQICSGSFWTLGVNNAGRVWRERLREAFRLRMWAEFHCGPSHWAVSELCRFLATRQCNFKSIRFCWVLHWSFLSCCMPCGSKSSFKPRNAGSGVSYAVTVVSQKQFRILAMGVWWFPLSLHLFKLLCYQDNKEIFESSWLFLASPHSRGCLGAGSSQRMVFLEDKQQMCSPIGSSSTTNSPSA